MAGTSVSRKLLTTLVALLALALLAPAATAAKSHRGAVARAAAACPDADLVPAAGNLRRIRGAILCLHNEIRAQSGLSRLHGQARLRRAAAGYARRMVRDGFFDHTTPAGVTMEERIDRVRYVRPGDDWTLGENLAWGTGALATPRGIVRGWMDSPDHRRQILEPSFRDAGVGVALGAPVPGAAGATYTVDFGVRR
jgi:uncharacterized protein YkwD